MRRSAKRIRQKQRQRARRKQEKRQRLRAPDERLCESLIEARLLRHLTGAVPTGTRITPQAPIGNYRADLLVELRGVRIVVEADGAEWHTSPEQVARDRARDAFMRRQGYVVMRFTGSEIARGAHACAASVVARLASPSNPQQGLGQQGTSDRRARREAYQLAARERRLARVAAYAAYTAETSTGKSAQPDTVQTQRVSRPRALMF